MASSLRRAGLETAGIARLEELLVEIADYKERHRARLKRVEDRAEARRQAYRRRLDAILTGIGARVPAPLRERLVDEELLFVFGSAEIGVLERLIDSRRTRRRR
jgi:hypothetical protein